MRWTIRLRIERRATRLRLRTVLQGRQGGQDGQPATAIDYTHFTMSYRGLLRCHTRCRLFSRLWHKINRSLSSLTTTTDWSRLGKRRLMRAIILSPYTLSHTPGIGRKMIEIIAITVKVAATMQYTQARISCSMSSTDMFHGRPLITFQFCQMPLGTLRAIKPTHYLTALCSEFHLLLSSNGNATAAFNSPNSSIALNLKKRLRCSQTGCGKVRIIWPVTKLSWIASNADPLSAGWDIVPIQQEDLKP